MVTTMLHEHRPVLLSVVQYQTELQNGTLTLPQLTDKAVALGVDGIELRPGLGLPSRPHEIATLRSLLKQAGLLVTYATFNTLFGDTKSGASLKNDIEMARDLGAGQVRVFQGTAPSDDPALWGSARLAWESAAMDLDYAKSQNVRVALENFGTPPGASVSEISRVLEQLWNPADLQTNLDIGNYANYGEDVMAAIQFLGPRIVSTHLKDLPAPPDTSPTYLGGGRLPLPEILYAFAALPQRILHVLEFDGGGEPDERIAKSLRYLRERNGAI